MTTKPMNSRQDILNADQALIDGTQKLQAQLPPTMSVASETVKPADIVARILGRITTGKAVVAAEAAFHEAVKKDVEERASTRRFVRSYKRILIGMFEETPTTLAEFGLTPPAAAQRTAAEKAAAAEKSRATRQARGTRGSKQKKAVHGQQQQAPQQAQAQEQQGQQQPPPPKS